MFGNLLINEPPLQVLPTLAKKIGLNEAIITQQVHYWLQRSKNQRDGFTWVYKTYPEWQEEFPFWSESTIKRTITSLEKQKILIATSKYNKMPMDRTKWYTLCYSALQPQPIGQNDTMLGSDCTDAEVKMTRCSGQVDTMQQVNMTSAITIDYTETTSENTTKTTTTENQSSLSSEIFKLIESNNIAVLTDFTASEVDYMINDTSEELVLQAVKIAVENNARNLKYIKSIIRNWHNKGYKTIEQVNAAEKQRKGKPQQEASNYMKETYGDLPF